jgi:hypothetical protein
MQALAEALDLAVKPVARRSGLIAERQPLVFRGKLLHKFRGRRPAVVDFADKPHLPLPTGVRDCNRIA